MEELGNRIRAFDNSLESFKAETFPSWQTGQMFNAFLETVKKKHSDDPVVQSISPAEEGVTAPGALGKSVAKMDVGTMRAALAQMQSLEPFEFGIG